MITAYDAAVDSYRHDGLTFDVLDAGPRDGVPVVLLHGFPQDATSWNAVAGHLNAAGLRTLAPDQRGYSPGARPPQRRAYTPDLLADDVIALLDAAGVQRAHLVGHDWGGFVAWHLAGRNPDRLWTVTPVSVPHPQSFLRSLVRSDQLLRSWYMAAFQLPVLPERGVFRSLGPALRRSGLPAEAARHVTDRFRTAADLTTAMDWYRGLPFAFRSPTRPSRVPTTFVWGRGDRFLGRAGAEGTVAFVQADYRFVELDAGHWIPDTHPAELAGIILERAGVPGH